MRLLTLVCALYCITTAFGQEGQNDFNWGPELSFNSIRYAGVNGLSSNEVRALAVYPDGRALVGGVFNNYNETAAFRIVRLLADGSRDMTFASPIVINPFFSRINAIEILPNGNIMITGAFEIMCGQENPCFRTLAILSPNGQYLPISSSFNSGEAYAITPDGTGKYYVGVRHTSATYSKELVTRVDQNGVVDTTFDGQNQSYHGDALALALQPDGKIIAGGTFDRYWGSLNNRIVRINPDGTKDMSFQIGSGFNSDVTGIALTADGAILVTGFFTQYNGQNVRKFAKLSPDGTLDPGFGAEFIDYITVANNLRSVEVQSDGKILISGGFNHTPTGYKGFIRLNPDGTIDTTFQAPVENNAAGLCTQVMADGRIMVGGIFSNYFKSKASGVARLQSNGVIDGSFNPVIGTDVLVRVMKKQPDGKLLIGGGFSQYGNQTCIGIFRIHPDGTLDPSFNPGHGFLEDTITDIDLYPDGRILVSGIIKNAFGEARHGIVRLMPNGDIDPSFTTSLPSNLVVERIALHPNGKIYFSNHPDYLRLNDDGSFDTDYFKAPEINSFGIRRILIDDENRVLYAGGVKIENFVTMNTVIRVLPNGTLDQTFTAPVASNTIFDIKPLPGGGYIIVGNFTQLNQQNGFNRMARLQANGTLDTSFIQPNFSGIIQSVEIAPDGKIIAGGGFIGAGGSVSTRRIAVFHPNGSLYTAFSTDNTNEQVLCTAVVENALWVGGTFTQYQNNQRNFLNRVHFTTGPLSIDDPQEHPAMQWSIAPNPVDDIIALPQDLGINQWNLYTLDGRRISHGVMQPTIHVSHLPSGLYLLQIQGDSWQRTLKWIKK